MCLVLPMLLLQNISLVAGLSPNGESSSEFYYSKDGHLYLRGVRARVLGASSYGILSGFLGIGSVTNSVPDSGQRIRDASESGLMINRFWLDVAPSDYWFRLAYSKFSDSPSHQAYFSALDAFVSTARKNGVYLVQVLASAYDQWTRLGETQSPRLLTKEMKASRSFGTGAEARWKISGRRRSGAKSKEACAGFRQTTSTSCNSTTQTREPRLRRRGQRCRS